MDPFDNVGDVTAAPINPNLKDTAALDKEEHREFWGTVGSLLSVAGITRPDISFDVAVVSGATKAATVADAKREAKVVK